MHKNTLWLFFVLVLMYLALVYCDDRGYAHNPLSSSQDNALQRFSADILTEEARTRRRHGLRPHLWGWHALAIAYWIKVKLVIIGFFVGSAIFVGLRYIWPHRCSGEVVRESPIVYDHPPSFYNHDHVPYSFDHSSSFGPYSSYSSSSFSDVVEPASGPDVHEIKKRSISKTEQRQRRPVATEEQIAEMMFYFLGLDTKACRRRFICEMEFRSRLHPLTSMAFRIVGRGFFEKYTNAHNELGRANSFTECADVNPECVFIEQNDEAPEATDDATEIVDNDGVDTQQDDVAHSNASNENANTADNEIDSAAAEMEQRNQRNLKAERRLAKIRRRGDRQLNPLAQRILSNMQNHHNL